MEALTHYLDASFLVALFAVEPFSERAVGFVSTYPTGLVVSDFAAAEFASATARRVRIGEVTIEQARIDLADFDGWVARAARRVNTWPRI